MATDLAGYVRVYEDLVPKGKCKEYVDFYEKFKMYHDKIENQGRPNFTQLNITVQSEKAKEFENVQKELVAFFNEGLRKYGADAPVTDFQFPPRYAYEHIRIKKYRNNDLDCFDLHTDVGDFNSARRFLAFFLYLNDVEIGGETNFPDLNVKVAPKAGSVLIFPPMWPWRHAGLKPVTGPKYIVGSYLHYL